MARTFIGYHVTDPREVARVEEIARYCGTNRSAFLRLAVAFLDSAVVLDELTRLADQQGGTLTSEQDAVRDEAMTTMGDVLAALRPRPLVPLSAN
jgi:hypothetical protein